MIMNLQVRPLRLHRPKAEARREKEEEVDTGGQTEGNPKPQRGSGHDWASENATPNGSLPAKTNSLSSPVLVHHLSLSLSSAPHTHTLRHL
jgi:hypothetical protein